MMMFWRRFGVYAIVRLFGWTCGGVFYEELLVGTVICGTLLQFTIGELWADKAYTRSSASFPCVGTSFSLFLPINIFEVHRQRVVVCAACYHMDLGNRSENHTT